MNAGPTPEDVAAAADRLCRDGVAVLPGVLTAPEAADALDRLWAAAEESRRQGIPTFMPVLDPNAHNVRVFNLIALDPLFAELIAHPVADAVAAALLGPGYIVSNFTANIARPGAGSMAVHSDLAIVAPEPWTAPGSLNVIWCLTDVTAENGGTLHLPGSHRFATMADVFEAYDVDRPEDLVAHMVPFEAPAGSIVAMDGRVWHTSGRNVTADEDRALLFAYYAQPWLRPQWNFTRSLPADVQAACNPVLRYRLGLDHSLNTGDGELIGRGPLG